MTFSFTWRSCRRLQHPQPSLLARIGQASQLVIPHVDLDRMWSAHAVRCLSQLPDELGCARPLFDPREPLVVLCAASQARALILWHHHLPTDLQASFICRRLPPRPGTDNDAGQRPTPERGGGRGQRARSHPDRHGKHER